MLVADDEAAKIFSTGRWGSSGEEGGKVVDARRDCGLDRSCRASYRALGIESPKTSFAGEAGLEPDLDPGRVESPL